MSGAVWIPGRAAQVFYDVLPYWGATCPRRFVMWSRCCDRIDKLTCPQAAFDEIDKLFMDMDAEDVRVFDFLACDLWGDALTKRGRRKLAKYLAAEMPGMAAKLKTMSGRELTRLLLLRRNETDQALN